MFARSDRCPPRLDSPPLDVHEARTPVVPDLPAGLVKAVAPVQILHVQPVGLVQQTHLLDRAAAHEHEGSVDRVDLALPALGHLGRPVLREGAPRDAGSEPPDLREVRERSQRRRERALGGVVEGAVGLHQATAEHPHLRDARGSSARSDPACPRRASVSGFSSNTSGLRVRAITRLLATLKPAL